MRILTYDFVEKQKQFVSRAMEVSKAFDQLSRRLTESERDRFASLARKIERAGDYDSCSQLCENLVMENEEKLGLKKTEGA